MRSVTFVSKTPTPTRNADRTRGRLLRAAIRLFSSRGFHGVSVDQIVAAAKINKRMVYHYFGSKEAIYQAALADVFSRIAEVELLALDDAGTPHEQITGLLRGYFQFLDDNPEFTQLLLWENLDKGRHIAKQDDLISKNPFLQRFQKIVEQGISSGLFRADINIPHLLIHFIGLCFIYHSNRFSLTQSVGIDLGDNTVRRDGLDQVITLVFKGIEAKPAPTQRASNR
jgi:AcrR family transcriptional regulator